MESPHTTATTGHSMSAATFHTNMVVSSMEAAHTAHVSHALAGAARRRRGMRTEKEGGIGYDETATKRTIGRREKAKAG